MRHKGSPRESCDSAETKQAASVRSEGKTVSLSCQEKVAVQQHGNPDSEWSLGRAFRAPTPLPAHLVSYMFLPFACNQLTFQ